VSSYTDPNYIGFLMDPAADCDLDQFLRRMSDDADFAQVHRRTLKHFFGCLATAIDYLHSNGFRHRDLKPSNILVHDFGVYVADFGTSLDWLACRKQTTQDRIPVSEYYMAPEVAKNKPRGLPMDMWALGAVYLEMVTVLLGKDVDDLRGQIEVTSLKR